MERTASDELAEAYNTRRVEVCRDTITAADVARAVARGPEEEAALYEAFVR